MVLEHLFPEDWLEKRAIYAFIIAVVYSILGIAAARLLFGANAGIVSVIFTSLFILPYLQKIMLKEDAVFSGMVKKGWIDSLFAEDTVSSE